MFVLGLVVAGSAGAIPVLNNHHGAAVAALGARQAELAPAPAIVLRSNQSSELPEPEVFAMMLLGLVLIGYRARRDSSEKFK